MASLPLEKPHAIFIPYPAQGHINPLLQLAKLFHSKGFYITFVNTEFNHKRLVRSRGPDSVKGSVDFQFETVPDGLPSSDEDRTQDIAALCDSARKNCKIPLSSLIVRLNDSPKVPPVTCIISDAVMSFTLGVAEELGIPEIVFYTMSACGCMGYLNFEELTKRGYIPLKDESYLANGYLDTQIDWIPGMRNIRLRDFPSFIRTTDPDDIMVSYNTEQATNSLKAWGLILNTFDDFEHEVLDAIKSKFPRLYTVGPLFSLCNRIPESPTKAIELNLWKEDDGCIEWLDQREAASVIYVNFGSIAIVTSEQLREFAWGFANSEHPFLWIIRPDLVRDDSGILSEEFFEATRGRCLISSWCAQEQVLAHPSVGGFLTHCGWNSMLESICGGIPMLCWPFFSEQYTNCRYAGEKWGIGMEVDNNVKRDEIEGLVRELMEGQKGKEMRKNAMEWKEKGENAIKQGGSSYVNIDRLFRDVLSTMAN